MQGNFTRDMEKWYRDWFSKFTDQELGERIGQMERLLDMELFVDGLLCDEGSDILEMLRDECVRRVTGKCFW